MATGKPAKRTSPRAKATAKRRGTTPSTARAAPSALDASAMAAHVAAELQRRGRSEPTAVVATIAAVGVGYRTGPAHDPGFLHVAIDIDALVAEALVERWADGVRPADIDREMHRTTVRATVDQNLEQLDVDASEPARGTLASLALGSWRPGFDEHARRNAIAGFLVRWYAAGLG